MRRLLVVLAVLFALSPGLLHAQQGTLTTPETSTKIVVDQIVFNRNPAYASVTVGFQDAGGVTKRVINYAFNSAADVVSLLTAMDTVRATETGNQVRKTNFRVLGWLVDNSRLTNDDGSQIAVTLVP